MSKSIPETWLDRFLFDMELVLSDARMPRIDRMNIRWSMERVFKNEY